MIPVWGSSGMRMPAMILPWIRRGNIIWISGKGWVKRFLAIAHQGNTNFSQIDTLMAICDTPVKY